ARRPRPGHAVRGRQPPGRDPHGHRPRPHDRGGVVLRRRSGRARRRAPRRVDQPAPAHPLLAGAARLRRGAAGRAREPARRGGRLDRRRRHGRHRPVLRRDRPRDRRTGTRADAARLPRDEHARQALLGRGRRSGVMKRIRAWHVVVVWAIVYFPWLPGPLTGILPAMPYEWVLHANQAGEWALVAFSLVLLTGWVGQISLGQGAFVGIGAFVTALLATRWHLAFPLN